MRHKLVLLLACAALLGLCSVASGSRRSDSWSQADNPVLRLEVNLPAFRVDLWTATHLLRSYRVAVGARRFRTPTGEYELSRIIWNPWWVPPASEWAQDEKVTPPGPDNPMGRVKLNFGPMYYLHGTPLRESIGTAASHGCLRMLDEDAIELARFIQAFGGSPITSPEVDSLLDERRETRGVDVPGLVVVRIVYRLAEMRGDTLVVHPDIYRTRQWSSVRALALEVLMQAGVDTMDVDQSVLAGLLEQGRTRETRAAVESLLSRP